MSERRVYFAKCFAANGADMGAIKIGCSYHWEDGARLKAIQVNSPFTLDEIGSFRGDLFEENILHCWLRPQRIAGEYFHVGGEVSRLAQIVADTGQNPLPFSAEDKEGIWLSWSEVRGFMDRYALTADNVAAVTGSSAKYYQHHIDTSEVPNRRFVAGLTVAAMRMGHRVYWRSSFAPTRRKAA